MVNETRKGLETLHTLTLNKCIEMLKDPECSAADMNIAIKFLKDNNIDVDTINVDNGEDTVSAETLPFEVIEDTGT